MTMLMEHCYDKIVEYSDDKRVVHCDDVSCSIVLTSTWSIVMTTVMEHCAEKSREYCDDKSQREL